LKFHGVENTDKRNIFAPEEARNFAAMPILRTLLVPLALVYAFVVFIRNRMFDVGLFRSQRGALPTIVVGNLVTGGTGKTPFSEFLLRKLSQHCSPALLSRGYGRKSSGFMLAGHKTTFSEIGDEPYQIHQKFPNIPLAVCEDRLNGIRLLKEKTEAQLVVLDDAFQHRRLRADINILLTEYGRPFWKDFSLPTGNLRDSKIEKRRADFIVVTKCPYNLTEEEKTEVKAKINASKTQRVYFSSMRYGSIRRLNGLASGEVTRVVGMAGLANTALFEDYLKEHYQLISFKKFADHHNFSRNDILQLWNECGNFADALMITEKDAVKLEHMEGIVNIPVYVLPIEVYLHEGEADMINRIFPVLNQGKL
jgi:tetraacyldisaccharide 4'-kinase